MKPMMVLAIAATVAGCASTQPTFQSPAGVTVQPATPIDGLSAEQRGIVENHVRRSLVDPQSAVFEGLRSGINPNTGDVVTCGLVNARNRMGGFAGRELFHVVIESETGQAADLGAFFMAAQICQNWHLVPNA